MRGLLVGGLMLVLAGCGSDGYSSAPAPSYDPQTGGNGGDTPGETTNQIAVRDNSFDPNATTVAPGTTVTWTFEGSNLHNITFSDASLGSSGNKSSGTYTKNFPDAGTFAYHCSIHGNAMSGVVTVE